MKNHKNCRRKISRQSRNYLDKSLDTSAGSSHHYDIVRGQNSLLYSNLPRLKFDATCFWVSTVIGPFLLLHQQDDALTLLVVSQKRTTGDAAFDRFAAPVSGIDQHLLLISIPNET
jgi:hypothetical protein